MKIETEHTTIREFSERDLFDFSKYRACPSVARYQSWEDYTYAEAVELYKNMKSVEFATVGHWFQIAIEDRANKHLLGDLAFHFVDADQVEIGFTVAPENQGKGIASEAVSAALSYLFGRLGKHRVYAVIDVKNGAARGLLEKLAFRKEAHFLENIYFKGSWGSEYVYAKLNHEWRNESRDPHNRL